MFCLSRRKNVYYFRLRVPEDVRTHFGMTEIKRSLHTTRYRSAVSIAKNMIGAAERVFTMIRTLTLDDETIRKLVADYKRQQLRIEEGMPTRQ